MMVYPHSFVYSDYDREAGIPFGYASSTRDSIREYQENQKKLREAAKKHTELMIAILQDWWEAKNNGSANNRSPSLDCEITQEEADKQIKTIDHYSQDEWDGQEIFTQLFYHCNPGMWF